jgi:Fe-S cluster assembly protein SufD
MTATTSSQPAQAAEPLAPVAAFDAFEKEGARRFPSWVGELQRTGIARFAALGFPTPRLEDWRYTNITPIAQRPFKPALDLPPDALPEAEVERFVFAGMGGSRLVFVNGQFAPEHSDVSRLTPGVRLCSLAAAIHSGADLVKRHLGRYAMAADHAFRALNTAFFTDGAFIFVPKNAVVEEPVHLLFISGGDGEAVHPRNLIIAEAGSRLKVVESYVSVGGGAGFTNAVTEIVAGEGANVEHCKFQDESLETFHVATVQSCLARDSRFMSHSISVGAQIARHDVNTVMIGEGVECVLNGL